MNHPLPDTGETPLHAALCKANRLAFEPVVDILLAHDADCDAATKRASARGSFMRDCRTWVETLLPRVRLHETE